MHSTLVLSFWQVLRPQIPQTLPLLQALAVAAPHLYPHPTVGLRHSHDYHIRRAYLTSCALGTFPLDRERGDSPLHYAVALPYQEGLCSV